MAIRFQCKCGKSFKVADQYAGKRTKCTNCGAALVIPAAGDSSAPPPKLELKPVSPGAESPVSLPQEPDASGDLLLEAERFGAAGKAEEPPPAAEDEVPLATEVTGVPPPSAASDEPLPVEPLPDEPADLSGQAGAKCPKCGEPAAPGAATCMKCGASLTAAPPAAVAGKKPGPPAFLQSLRNRREFPLIVAGAAVLVIGLVILGVVLVRKSHKRAQLAAAEKMPRQALHPPRPARPPKVNEEPAPSPQPEIRWSGFSDLSTLARDRILKTGLDLLAFLERTTRPAETLAEAGIPESESAACVYVGPEVAALNRFRILLYEAKPDSSGRQWAFFSDGSARLLSSAQLPAALLRKTPAGWMTGEDIALLESISPQVRVGNIRFASLEVALDGNPLGAVPREGSRVFPTTPGAHELAFTAGGLTDTLKVEFMPGLLYAYVHPRQQDLPAIAVRQYRAALQGQASPYTAEKEGPAIKGLQGPKETVTFPEGDGRNSLAPDLRWLDAQIVQDEVTIEGFDNKRILVSEVGRLEEGALRYKNDLIARFRKTPLGTLRSDELPNIQAAALAMSESGETTPPVQTSGRPAPGRQGLPRPGMALARGAASPVASPAASPLVYPNPAFRPSPDCQALADVLSSAAPGGIQQLLFRIQLAQEFAGASRLPAGQGRGRAVLGGGRGMGARAFGPRAFGPRGRGLNLPYGGTPSSGSPPVSEQPLRPPEISPHLLYGALAVYGAPSAVDALSSIYEKINPATPAYAQLLLALARSGRGLALAQLRAAATQTPANAAIALCMVDDPAARAALAEVVAAWSNREVVATAQAWPALAGPTCRVTFLETLASANPGLFNDAAALNALMKLEPYALERVLAARLEAEFAPPPTPAEPPTPTAPAASAAPPAPTASATPTQPEAPAAPSRSRRGQGRRGGRSFGGGVARRPAGLRASPIQPVTAGPAAAVPPYWLVLAHFKNTVAVTQFVQFLAGNSPQKRQQAVDALAAVPDASVFPVLAEVLKEKDPRLRRTAATALVETGEAAVVPILDAAMDKDLLLAAIVDQAPSLAAKAGAGPTAALLAKMLTCSLQEKKPPEAKPRAAAAPPEGPQKKTASELAPEQALTTPQAILAALVRLGDRSPAVNAAIESARKNAELAVRIAAFRASAQLVAGDTPAGRSPALATLAMEAIRDPQAAVRVAGIDLLQGAEAQAAIPILETAAKDADPAVRAAVMNALAGLAGEDARVSKLVAAGFSDPQPTVVSAAAQAAARRKDTALGPALVALLNKAPERGNDKAAALPALAEAAGIVQAQGATNSLILLLANAQPEVRVAAAHALGALKDPTAVSSLVSAAQDYDPAVLTAVIGALSEFDSPAAIQGTLDTLKREDVPPGLRQQILSRLVSLCAESEPYGDWATSGPALPVADLDFLASAAPSAPPASRAGMIMIARRYLADTGTDVRIPAAKILAGFADDASARAALLEGFERNAQGIGTVVAEVLSQIRDPAMIERPLLNYYRQLSEAGPGSGSSTAAGPAATRGPPPAASGSATASGPRIPGLAKASAEENAMLRAAIIQAIGEIGGNDAAKALRQIELIEKGKNSAQMTKPLIAALESAKSPETVRLLCEYASKGDSASALAIAALGRVAQARSGSLVTDTLLRLTQSTLVSPDIAAAAADALDEIKNANPQPG